MIFEINESDIRHVEETYLASKDPLVIASWPAKEKRRYILINMVASHFEKGRMYSEREINDVIVQIYDDYVSIRRYLVDYRFLKRTDNGSTYWTNDEK